MSWNALSAERLRKNVTFTERKSKKLTRKLYFFQSLRICKSLALRQILIFYFLPLNITIFLIQFFSIPVSIIKIISQNIALMEENLKSNFTSD